MLEIVFGLSVFLLCLCVNIRAHRRALNSVVFSGIVGKCTGGVVVHASDCYFGGYRPASGNTLQCAFSNAHEEYHHTSHHVKFNVIYLAIHTAVIVTAAIYHTAWAAGVVYLTGTVAYVFVRLYQECRADHAAVQSVGAYSAFALKRTYFETGGRQAYDANKSLLAFAGGYLPFRYRVRWLHYCNR